MMRIMKLSSHFKSFSFIAINRDPYANCASILYRHHDAENIESEQRLTELSIIAKDWINRSLVINELVTTHEIPLITYEEFCNKPETLIMELNLPQGVVDTIDVNAVIKVKDYEPQRVINQNDRQISKLTGKEILMILGKGIENYQIINNKKYQHNDVDIVKSLI